MKKLRLFVFSSAAFLLAAAGSVGACSSEDTTVTPDGGPGTDAPIGNTDGPTGSETSTNEAGTDAPVDTGFDTANYDAGLKIDTFAATVADAICDSLARCCFGSKDPADASIDGGSFNRPECMRVYGKLGFESSLIGGETFADGGSGKVTLDQFQAEKCLQKIDALACNLPAAQFQDIRSSCFSALRGTVAAGGACTRTMECASGTYCKPPAGSAIDGVVVGQCTALAGQGGNCSIQDTGDSQFDAPEAEVACSNRASGDTKLHCEFFQTNNPDPDPNGLKKDRSQWKCVPNVPLGETCIGSVWCANGICNPDDLKCTDPLVYFKQVCKDNVVP